MLIFNEPSPVKIVKKIFSETSGAQFDSVNFSAWNKEFNQFRKIVKVDGNIESDFSFTLNLTFSGLKYEYIS